MMQKIQNDAGQTSIFIVGVTAILLLFTLTIAAITSVTLEHRKLLSLGDAAVQQAATSFITSVEEPAKINISEQTARQDIQRHLESTLADQRFAHLKIVDVKVVAESTVHVQLSARAYPPVINWVLPDGVTVVAESSARTQLAQ